MSFSREFIERLSSTTGFQAANLEKVGYLIPILQNISEHPFLQTKLALKGGTAINPFYFKSPRLSVDIDLNYIGSIDRKMMLREKSRVEEALQRILQGLGMTVRRVPQEHAGGKWRLRFASVFGEEQTLELDVNYLMRSLFIQWKDWSHLLSIRIFI